MQLIGNTYTMNNQLQLFSSNAQPPRWIMFSLKPQYFKQVCTGTKKIEYRRGVFTREPVFAFVYCSSPVMAVGAVVKLGKPIIGTREEIAQIKEADSKNSYAEMLTWLEGATKASAIPIESVQTFEPIKLQELRNNFTNFHPPQRYMYLDTNPELLQFLKQRSNINF